ncbi:MAG: glycosyltransferase [Ruminococcus sp.]|nr:glycosyltransferase [Ruminococcus sp.]
MDSKKRALVSIIVPVYNVSEYLDRCIESIVNQTYRDIEVVLIDDGSTDNCPQMCDEWAEKDSRIRVIHKSNAGVSVARNLGIQKATGEYITFVDSDDYVYPEYCSKLVQLMETEKADLTHCRCVWEEKNMKPVPDFYNITSKNFSDCGCSWTVWCNMFKTDIIRKNDLKFREDIASGEDTLFVLEYFVVSEKAVGTSEKLYFYEQGSLGLLRQDYSERRHSVLTAMELCAEISKDIDSMLYEDYMISLASKAMELFFLLNSSQINKKKGDKKKYKEWKKDIIRAIKLSEKCYYHSKKLEKNNKQNKIKIFCISHFWTPFSLVYSLKKCVKK